MKCAAEGPRWWSSDSDFTLPVQGVKAHSLVRELRSHMVCGMTKRLKKKKKKKEPQRKIKQGMSWEVQEGALVHRRAVRQGSPEKATLEQTPESSLFAYLKVLSLTSKYFLWPQSTFFSKVSFYAHNSLRQEKLSKPLNLSNWGLQNFNTMRFKDLPRSHNHLVSGQKSWFS